MAIKGKIKEEVTRQTDRRNCVGFCHGNAKVSSVFISVGVDTDVNNIMVVRIAIKMIECIRFALL